MRKILAVLAGVVIVAVVAAFILVTFFMPRQRPPGDIVVEITPELLERGTYLVEHVLLCNDCHSERDWTRYGGPPMPPFGAGRACMTRETQSIGIRVTEGQGNFPGVLCIRNITPDPESGIGNWTDGEIIRSVREGVDHKGLGLFPIMPYFIYRSLSDDDAAAVVAYMRNLEPVKASRPERSIDFPMSMLIELFPEPLDGPVAHPDSSDSVAYGEYLATISRCGFCHTPRQGRGKEGIPGKEFAGGVPFQLGSKVAWSKNLTPDATGIGTWTRDAFIALFKQHEAAADEPPGARTVARLEDNSFMDWTAYAGMTEADLGAIYDFLQSLPPVRSAEDSY
jgi:mono/diheme cytochrome c family protein